MKIFSCSKVGEIDRYTIDNEPVSSSDLMERAAGKLFEWFSQHYSLSTRFLVFTGHGNNGGDGLVLARLLWYGGYRTEVYDVNVAGEKSAGWILNRERLVEIGEIPFYQIEKQDDLPVIPSDGVVIDGIFGSGLSRPVEGLTAEVIRHINRSAVKVISIDIPSGLFGEDNSNNIHENIIKADVTLTLQFPKLSFMFADNYPFTGEWHIIPIGLHPEAIRKMETPYYFIEEHDITGLLKTRGRFDHKGKFGHGLLVAGSRNKTGAAILAARAALRAGIGLITCHTSSAGCGVIQSALPEAMIQPDSNDSIISDIIITESFNAFAFGPGTGTAPETSSALYNFLSHCKKPLVLDADAINILGLHKEWLSVIPPLTILTPHLREFERIAGKAENGYQRMKSQIAFSEKYNCIVVLKGAFTSVSLPDGTVTFNSTGNPGMATAGSGDALTGIILSLLAQGYSPEDASKIGVYIHGLAGDLALNKYPVESVTTSDIIENIGNAIGEIRKKQ